MRSYPRAPSLALRAIHLVSRLRRVADMCSSRVSGIAYRLSNGRTLCAPTEEKILCRSPFSKRSPVSGLRRIRKQRETGVKRVETVGVYPLAPRRGYGAPPAAGRGTLPPPAGGESPAEVQRKTSRPERANPPAAVRAPRSAGAEKAAAPFGRTACAVRVSRLTLRSYLTILREQSMLSQQQNRRKYEPVHPCTLRSVPRH